MVVVPPVDVQEPEPFHRSDVTQVSVARTQQPSVTHGKRQDGAAVGYKFEGRERWPGMHLGVGRCRLPARETREASKLL